MYNDQFPMFNSCAPARRQGTIFALSFPVMQLVLDSHGASLSVRDGLFRVRTPAGAERLLAPRAVQAILFTRGVHLSSDALALAIHHDIPALLLDDTGHPVGHFWSGQYGSIATIRKRQARWADSAEGRVWVRDLLHRKVSGQRELLRALADEQPESRALENAVGRALPALHFVLGQLSGWSPADETDPAATLDRFRGWEGVAARHYWSAVSAALPERFRFAQRSTHPARDPFNALLNYAYGVLYAQVELALLKAGLDPAMGVLHADQHRRPTLVYDCIEPYRVWADTVVIRLARRAPPLPDTAFRRFEEDGSVWLEAAGKGPLLDALLAYLEETVERRKKQFQRRTAIDLDAQKLASLLKRSAR